MTPTNDPGAQKPANGFWSGCGTVIAAEVICGAALLIVYLGVGDRFAGCLLVAAVSAPLVLAATMLVPGRWSRRLGPVRPDNPTPDRDAG